MVNACFGYIASTFVETKAEVVDKDLGPRISEGLRRSSTNAFGVVSLNYS